MRVFKACLAALLLIGPAALQPAQKVVEEIVAVVNDEIITLSAFKAEYEARVQEAEARYRGEELEKLALNEEARQIAPGESADFPVIWADIKGFGRFKARLEAEYGEADKRDLNDTVFFWVLPAYALALYGGGVAILHDSQANTAAQLPALIAALRGAGVTFVPLGDASVFPLINAAVNPPEPPACCSD